MLNCLLSTLSLDSNSLSNTPKSNVQTKFGLENGEILENVIESELEEGELLETNPFPLGQTMDPSVSHLVGKEEDNEIIFKPFKDEYSVLLNKDVNLELSLSEEEDTILIVPDSTNATQMDKVIVILIMVCSLFYFLDNGSYLCC
jgi:hypothetical protein